MNPSLEAGDKLVLLGVGVSLIAPSLLLRFGAFMYFHLELRGDHAGELPYLLGKNPDRLFEWEVGGSQARVFFSCLAPHLCRVVVLFWPDVRTALGRTPRRGQYQDYVSARSFTINTLFCAALKAAFNALVSGHRHAPVDLMDRVHDLECFLSPIQTNLPGDRLRSLFLPLGYEVEVTEVSASLSDPEIRQPLHCELRLRGKQRVLDALRHVLVMVPVMDSDRHEFTGQNDVERLRRFGSDWLDAHPERSFIIYRYLLFRRLVDLFLQGGRDGESPSGQTDSADDGYDASGEPAPVRQSGDATRWARLADSLTVLPSLPSRILVVGGGDGRLVAELVSRGIFEEVVCVDPSATGLERVRRKVERVVHFSQALNRTPTRCDLLVSCLGFDDARLLGFDTVVVPAPAPEEGPSRLPFLLAPYFSHPGTRCIVLAIPSADASPSPATSEAPSRPLWESLDTYCRWMEQELAGSWQRWMPPDKDLISDRVCFLVRPEDGR